jgi:type III secretory pathway component EscS
VQAVQAVERLQMQPLVTQLPILAVVLVLVMFQEMLLAMVVQV